MSKLLKPCQQSQQFPKTKLLVKCAPLVKTLVNQFSLHHHHHHHRHLRFYALLRRHHHHHHHRHRLLYHRSIIVHRHLHHRHDVHARKIALYNLVHHLIPYILIFHHLQLTLINPLDTKINLSLLILLLP